MADTLPLSTTVARNGAMHQAGHAARAFAESAPIQFLARFGYVVRGVIHLLPGVLALRLALGHQGAAIAPTGAISMIGHQPFGRFLLLVVLTGLAGYALWCFVRAFLDPLGRGHSLQGLGKRFGYCLSGVAYTGFLVLTVRLLMGSVTHAGQTQEWAGRLMAKPLGAWVLGIIGLCWIAGAGISEIAWGWRGRFEQDLRLDRMSPSERQWAVRLGRIGTVARGVIFAVIGFLLVTAAFHANPERAGGMAEAFREIARQPFGRVLLGAAALGLMVFGVFSMMCARWMRTRAAAPASGSHTSTR